MQSVRNIEQGMAGGGFIYKYMVFLFIQQTQKIQQFELWMYAQEVPQTFKKFLETTD